MRRFKEIAPFLALPTKLWRPLEPKWCNFFQKFLHQLMAIDVKNNLKKLQLSKYILSDLARKIVKMIGVQSCKHFGCQRSQPMILSTLRVHWKIKLGGNLQKLQLKQVLVNMFVNKNLCQIQKSTFVSIVQWRDFFLGYPM